MVHFYLPEFINNSNLYIQLIKEMNKNPHMFRDCKIGAIYGSFPGMIWNGGRVGSGFTLFSIQDVKGVFDTFESYNVPLRLTCTNLLIKEEHLNDTYCNMIMAEANKRCGVSAIVSSPLLEQYIRKHYPNIKLVSSTTKCVNSVEGLNRELEKDYCMVVPSYNLNNNFDKLALVSKPEKCELLVNELCRPNCPNRKKHYEFLSGISLMRDMTPYAPAEVQNCPYQNFHNFNFLDNIRDNPNAINVDDMYGKYAELGFNHFKLEGRGAMAETPYYTLPQLIYYMVKPEYHLYVISEMLYMNL